MKIKNTTPFLVGSKVTSTRPPVPEMMVVVRATYPLKPGVELSPIEGLDQGFLTADVFHEDDEARQRVVLYPSDFADFKPAADVMLRGTCFVPGGEAQSECEVGFGVGGFEKTLLVTGDRPWQGPSVWPLGLPGRAEPFVSQSLDYDQAYGGVGFAPNPAGRGRGDAQAPRVESPNDRLTRTNRPASPAGFGPLNPNWAPRARKVGKKYGKKYKKERAPYFSEDFDWTHFNSAPEDQQVQGYLRGDEALWFRNLYADCPEFETKLPGICIRLFVLDRDERFREVEMVLDTLFADTDNETLTLTWRGLDEVMESDLADVTSAMVISETLDATPEPADNFKPKLIEFEGMRPGFDELDEDVREKFEAAVEVSEKMKAAAKESPGEAPDIANILAPLSVLVPQDKLDAITSLAADAADATEGTDAAVDVGSILVEALAPKAPPLPMPMPLGPDHIPVAGVEDQLGKVVEMVKGMSEAAESQGIELHGIDGFYEGLKNPALALLAPNFVPPKAPGEEAEEGAEVDAPEFEPKENLREQDLRDRDFSGADLSNADLSKSDVTGVSFAGANLENAQLSAIKAAGADFSGANLKRAIFIQADVTKASFDRAVLHQTSFAASTMHESTFSEVEAFQSSFVESDLTNAKLSGAQCRQCDFSSAILVGADFSNTRVERSIFLEAEAEGANFNQAEIGRTTFMKSNLTRASFYEARGDSTSFQQATLDEADLRLCEFRSGLFMETSARGVNMTHADLRGARFYRTQLQDAEMVEMNLFEADLSRSNLAGARLGGSNLYGAFLNEMDLDDVDLSDVDLKHAVEIHS